MRVVDYSNIDLMDLKIFHIAAETLNFADVSRILYISPSVVSKRIAKFEKTTDLLLFYKNKGRVQLTPAGKELRKRTRHLIKMFDESLSEAHVVQRWYNNRCRIGFMNTNDLDVVTKDILSLREQFPDAYISAQVMEFPELREALAAGDLDVIITMHFETQYLSPEKVEWKLIKKLPLMAYIPKNNFLCHQNEVSFSDLRNQEFIFLAPALVPGYSKLIIQKCQEHGFEPMVVRYADNISDFLLALELNEGVVIADELMQFKTSNDIQCFPLEDEEHASSGNVVAWNIENKNPIVEKFIQNALSF